MGNKPGKSSSKGVKSAKKKREQNESEVQVGEVKFVDVAPSSKVVGMTEEQSLLQQKQAMEIVEKLKKEQADKDLAEKDAMI
jgi:hypothetical protein